MIQLVYGSRASRPVRFAELCKLLALAQRKNAARGVTGKLCFDGKCFVQVLEGDRDDVNAVYHHIARDPRHQELQILSVCEVEVRSFAEWHMAYCGVSEASKAVLERLGIPSLDPLELSAEAALAVLTDLPSLAKPEAVEAA